MMSSAENISRYKHAYRFANVNANNTVYLGTRFPVRFVDDRENTIHVVVEGDTLEALAARFFSGFEDSSSLWWVLAEFQPTPITDVTQQLEPGTLLMIPSRTLAHQLIQRVYSLEDEL